MANADNIKSIISEIQTHYDKNLNSKYVKNLSLKLDIPATINQDKNIVLVNDLIYIDSKGSIEDLYNGIRAVNYYVKEIEKNVLPHLSNYASSIVSTNENDKILQQMAIKNYPMNIQILKDMIQKLFIFVYDFDKLNFSKEPAYLKVRNFSELEEMYLSGNK
ncbi:MAG TPA: hypothetical protein PK385_10450 [Spirochaetota bacterium]|nr:hypothetical protein [Spirochaetota bacterium]HOS33219.1 hypothetical protein [Spirochaetota bacterium]HOS56465.1 hypothetical protein [Spirochaetota bacterium]HPK61425.1 hypothetical protein [Spirochaetota bacterium]HQF78816.1 hypothetical protein [Spirochaetota bacterium]